MGLYKYQQDYLSDLPKNIIMAADVGLGKTIMALEHARRWGTTRLVVIAPASKVRTGDWEREIEKFYSTLHDTTFPDGSTGMTVLDTPPYDVISYEMFTKKWGEFYDPNITMIIDESHMACNAATKRAKAILKVARTCHQWIMLSATPLPNGWKSGETYAILTGLSRHKTEFVSRFQIIDRSRGFPLHLGYREVPTLESWWARIAKPLKRTGSLKLPSQNVPIDIEMKPGVARTYTKALNQRVYEDELLDNPSKLFTTLRQIPTEARIEALHSVLDSTDEHIVVFYNYNTEREAILELLAKSFKDRKVYEQSGHKSHLPPRDKWSTLKPSVTLAQYQSASQAIELTYASVTVYLSPCTSFSNYEQSKGRTRRNGQEKTTLFYHVAVTNTLDKHIWGILKKKRDFSMKMFENTIDS